MSVGIIRLGEDVGGHSVLARRPFLICAEANVGVSAGRPQNPAQETTNTMRVESESGCTSSVTGTAETSGRATSGSGI